MNFRPVVVIVFCFLGFLHEASSQTALGLRGVRNLMAEDAPALLGSSFSAEGVVSVDVDENGWFTARASVGHISHNIRFPTFTTYAVVESGDEFRIYEGVLEQELFDVTYATVGFDFNFLRIEDYFKVYVGTDVVAGYFRNAYTRTIPQVSTRNADISEQFYGYRIRVGTAYSLTERLVVFSEGHYMRCNYPGVARFGTWDAGIGLKYMIRP